MNLDEFGNSAQANDTTRLGHLYHNLAARAMVATGCLHYCDCGSWYIRLSRMGSMENQDLNIWSLVHTGVTYNYMRCSIFQLTWSSGFCSSPTAQNSLCHSCDETFTPQRPRRNPLLLDANRATCSTPSRGQPVSQLNKIRLGYNLYILLICMWFGGKWPMKCHENPWNMLEYWANPMSFIKTWPLSQTGTGRYFSLAGHWWKHFSPWRALIILSWSSTMTEHWHSHSAVTSAIKAGLWYARCTICQGPSLIKPRWSLQQ